MALTAEGAATVHSGADPALVRAAQRGDPMALGELMELLLPYVGRICGPIALQDGADAAQEAMIKILRGIGELRDPAALFGWARVIAVREAVTIARRARAQAGDLADLSAAGDPQLGVDIADTLARLSPEHRAVLVVRDLEGLDEMEASRILAVQPGTVRSRLFRARVSFRKAWRNDS
jgi:RNA polymerase sigma factor (sigma-70 family)